MPSLVLGSSPLAGGRSVTISYRREGQGPALVFLHGGWGYDIYPIDTATLSAAHTLVVPSRSGYGQSSSLDLFPPDFHYCGVIETLALLDALGIERAVWWGHSDGAVIAAMAAIHAPERVDAVILEALHYVAAKPGSRAFFQRMAFEPETFNEAIRSTLAAEHGRSDGSTPCVTTARPGWTLPVARPQRRRTSTPVASMRSAARRWSFTEAAIRAPSPESWRPFWRRSRTRSFRSTPMPAIVRMRSHLGKP